MHEGVHADARALREQGCAFATLQSSEQLKGCAAAQSGLIITAAPQFNWTQQLSYMNYTVYVPNVVDLDNYRTMLSQLINITSGLVTGQPPWTSAGAPCNRPIPALHGYIS